MDKMKIYNHPNPLSSLAPILQRHLPYSGPLLRRIQSSHKSRTTSYLATFPPGSTSLPKSEPWLAAWVDIFCSPETQVWVYSSLEAEALQPAHNTLSKFTADSEEITTARAQFHTFLSYIRTELVPLYVSSLARDTNGFSTTENDVANEGTPKSQRFPPRAMLIGTLNSALVDFIYDAGSKRSRYSPLTTPVHILYAEDPQCAKYIFQSPKCNAIKESGSDNSLPPGYHFHDRIGRHGVQESHLDLVLSRTDIPRTKSSLNRMESTALYYDPGQTGNPGKQNGTEETPIGWVFLGFDGSMVTLHVEPEHRGRGLALSLGREIIKQGMGEESIFAQTGENGICEEEKGWVFADVRMNNAASRRVMEKMGGEVAWTIGWVLAEVCVPGDCDYCERATMRQNE